MEEKKHTVVIEERKRLTVSECDEVVSFNENEIVLVAEDTTFVIKGDGLKVEEVSKQSGDVLIAGECIDSVVYTRRSRKNKESVIRRILK